VKNFVKIGQYFGDDMDNSLRLTFWVHPVGIL